MVVKRQCSFCANEIEPGTGTMFVKRDGTVYHFCSSSCRKQQLNLGRVGHRHKWTRAHAMKRAVGRAAPAHTPENAPSLPSTTGSSEVPKRTPGSGPNEVGEPKAALPEEIAPATEGKNETAERAEAPVESAPSKPRRHRTLKQEPASEGKTAPAEPAAAKK